VVSEPLGFKPGRNYNARRGHNRFKFIGAGTRMNSLQRARSHPHLQQFKIIGRLKDLPNLWAVMGHFGAAIVWGLYFVRAVGRNKVVKFRVKDAIFLSSLFHHPLSICS
jgi:hypothetical protein